MSDISSGRETPHDVRAAAVCDGPNEVARLGGDERCEDARLAASAQQFGHYPDASGWRAGPNSHTSRDAVTAVTPVQHQLRGARFWLQQTRGEVGATRHSLEALAGFHLGHWGASR